MKSIAVVKVSDPVAVQTQLAIFGDEYDDGAIFVEIPELGLVGVENYVYCEYGLSIPYYRVNVDDEVLVEPTIGDDERFFYTGLVGCGRPAIAPGTTDQLKIITDTGKMTVTIGSITVEIDSVASTIKIGSTGASESFVLGDTLKAEIQKNVDALDELKSAFNSWVVLANDGGQALKTALATFLGLTFADLSSILSTKITGE